MSELTRVDRPHFWAHCSNHPFQRQANFQKMKFQITKVIIITVERCPNAGREISDFFRLVGPIASICFFVTEVVVLEECRGKAGTSRVYTAFQVSFVVAFALISFLILIFASVYRTLFPKERKYFKTFKKFELQNESKTKSLTFKPIEEISQNNLWEFWNLYTLTKPFSTVSAPDNQNQLKIWRIKNYFLLKLYVL